MNPYNSDRAALNAERHANNHDTSATNNQDLTRVTYKDGKLTVPEMPAETRNIMPKNVTAPVTNAKTFLPLTRRRPVSGDIFEFYQPHIGTLDDGVVGLAKALISMDYEDGKISELEKAQALNKVGKYVIECLESSTHLDAVQTIGQVGVNDVYGNTLATGLMAKIEDVEGKSEGFFRQSGNFLFRANPVRELEFIDKKLLQGQLGLYRLEDVSPKREDIDYTSLLEKLEKRTELPQFKENW